MTSIFKYDEPKRLTFTEGNPKTDKNLKLEEFKKYWILRLNLAPAKLSGFEVCSQRSKGCTKACLHTAGNAVFMKGKSKGRINRTRFYFQNRIKFLTQLFKEIKNHEINCKKKDLLPVCRLNTTSDISWEVHKIFEQFPNVQFYDYTKIKKRALKFVNGEYPNNYHLTFSLNEDNYKDSMDILSKGGNVAMVFRRQLPETYKGYQVVNGDEHDLRFLDLRNSIVGLKAKGKAKTDYSGFVLDI
jgi:hypothetical protein